MTVLEVFYEKTGPKRRKTFLTTCSGSIKLYCFLTLTRSKEEHRKCHGQLERVGVVPSDNFLNYTHTKKKACKRAHAVSVTPPDLAQSKKLLWSLKTTGGLKMNFMAFFQD